MYGFLLVYIFFGKQQLNLPLKDKAGGGVKGCSFKAAENQIQNGK